MEELLFIGRFLGAHAGSELVARISTPVYTTYLESPDWIDVHPSGGYLFASKTVPPNGQNEAGYAGGNQKVIIAQEPDLAYIDSAREFPVSVPSDGQIYVGICKYYRTNFKSYAKFRIYDMWIE